MYMFDALILFFRSMMLNKIGWSSGDFYPLTTEGKIFTVFFVHLALVIALSLEFGNSTNGYNL